MSARAGEGAGAAGPATPGELLRQARERRGMTMQQAAEELHLDLWIIEALEANRFLTLGAPVYARGHLRKYATLLGMAPAQVLERYEALRDTPAEPTPVPTSVALPPRPQRRSLRAPLSIAVLGLALAGGWAGYGWIQGRLAGRRPEVATAPQAVASMAAQAPAAPQPLQPAPELQAAQSAPLEQSSPPVAAQSSPAAAAGRKSGRVQLELEFSEPSWAEIYDATGARLMFDTGAPGRVHTLSGVPPLRVTLGLAAAVRMQVDGTPVAVPRRGGRDAARFLVEADGSVRRESEARGTAGSAPGDEVGGE